KTTSPCRSASTRLGNSVNRTAPVPVAGIVAADSPEVGLLEAESDRSRAARADRPPIHLDDRCNLDTRAAQEGLVRLVDLGPVDAAFDQLQLEVEGQAHHGAAGD